MQHRRAKSTMSLLCGLWAVACCGPGASAWQAQVGSRRHPTLSLLAPINRRTGRPRASRSVACGSMKVAREGHDGEGAAARATLLEAAKEGDLGTVERALKAGARTTATDDWGTTCLHLAVKGGHIQVIEALLQAGSDPDCASVSDDETSPLHCAVQRGALEIAQLLLSSGATATKEDEFGDLPLDIAKRNNNKPMIELLKSKSVAQTVVKEGSAGPEQGAQRIQYGDGHMSASEARRLMDHAVDWDAAELGREMEAGSVVEMVTDPATGDQFLRRVPLKRGARDLFPPMAADPGTSHSQD